MKQTCKVCPSPQRQPLDGKPQLERKIGAQGMQGLWMVLPPLLGLLAKI